jgi:hypothetical protein
VAIGIVTGRRISKNRDGDKDVLILQVSLIDGEDTRSIEIFSSADFNPANGTRVYICDVSDSYQVAVATSDGLAPEVEPGEVEIYSTDNPVTAKQARIYLNKDGEIILNQGTKSAVSYGELLTGLQNELSTINQNFQTIASSLGITLPTVTLNISSAEVKKVKLP